MPAMPGLTRSQLLAGAAAVALPRARRARRPRWLRWPLRCAARFCCPAAPPTRASRPVFNGRYAGVRPAAIAQPLDARDLAAALKVARAHGLAVRVRAGGHSYIGASTVAGGVVLDLRKLRGIRVLADGSVLAGAGLRQIELIAALARRGRAVVHGSCPTVGVAGFTLGGGYGFDARRYGLACDTLRRRARRRPAHAAAGPGRRRPPAGPARSRREPGPCHLAPAEDASRGQRDDVLRHYPWSRAAEIVARLHGALRIGARAARRDLLRLDGIALGHDRGVRAVPRHRAPGRQGDQGAARAGRDSSPRTRIPTSQAQLIFAGCLGKTLAQCMPQSEGGTLGHDTFAAGSAYIAHALATAEARKLVGVIACPAGCRRLGRPPARRSGRRDRRRRRPTDLVHPPRTCARRCRS